MIVQHLEGEKEITSFFIMHKLNWETQMFYLFIYLKIFMPQLSKPNKLKAVYIKKQNKQCNTLQINKYCSNNSITTEIKYQHKKSVP